MASPVPSPNHLDRKRLSSDEVNSLRLTPTPAENYRCPVSTPSNFVQRQARVVRRTKPLDNIYSQPTTAGRSQHSRGTVFTFSRGSRRSGSTARWAPKQGRALDYYFVDKAGDQREAQQTNTQWLKALCAQPVTEILNKYRRKTDVKRTRSIWSKTFSTPGEKSLLNAWENNVFKPRTKGIQSAIPGGAGRHVTSYRNLRQTQSEPPFSTTPFDDVAMKHHDDENSSVHSNIRMDDAINYGSPVEERFTTQGDKNIVYTPRNLDINGDDLFAIPSGESPRNSRILDQSSGASPRVTSYTEKLFRRVGRTGNVSTYTKVITGPEHLPRLSGRHKMGSIQATAPTYQAGTSRANSPNNNNVAPDIELVNASPQKLPSSPIGEEEEEEEIHNLNKGSRDSPVLGWLNNIATKL